MEENDAHEAGRLMGIAKTADVVDAVVVAVAMTREATILTSDYKDIERLVTAACRKINIARV
jgi:predicted nucleic acid-binding protein